VAGFYLSNTTLAILNESGKPHLFCAPRTCNAIWLSLCESIGGRISNFTDGVQKWGFKMVLADALLQVPIFKRIEREDILV